MQVTAIKPIYKANGQLRHKGYTFVSEKHIDASIRADLLNNLRNRIMSTEQAVAIATLQLSLYWCNGFYDMARKRYDEARKHVIDYANYFGYNIPYDNTGQEYYRLVCSDDLK